MASTSSPADSDDFVMLDTHHRHHHQCLPLRNRHFDDQAEQEHGSVTTDDEELQHISSPDSVISLDTISNSLSDFDDFTHVSSITSPARRSVPYTNPASPDHPRVRQVFQTLTEPSLPAEARAESSSQPSTLPLLSPGCHNHVSIDQQIMDLLIEHALTTRIEQEYGHGSANDKRLRQQMMARFRSLGADNNLVQEALSQTHGSKTLFQRQQRTVVEHEAIYRDVFTDVERIALSFFVECHIRHFEVACQFDGSYMPGDREVLYHHMQQPRAKEAKALALGIQMKILERLDGDRAFTDFFDDLRRQTRWQIDPPSNSHTRDHEASEAMTSSSTETNPETPCRLKRKMNTPSRSRYRSMELRRIFHATLTNLPNRNWSPDDPVNRGFIAASRREQPEGESEHNSNILSPPTKRPTLAAPKPTQNENPNTEFANTYANPQAKYFDAIASSHNLDSHSHLSDPFNRQGTPFHEHAVSRVAYETETPYPECSSAHVPTPVPVPVPDEDLTPMTTTAAHPENVRYLPDTRSNSDKASAKVLQGITMNILQMDLQDRLMRLENRESLDRDPLEVPYQVSLLALEELNSLSRAALRRATGTKQSGELPRTETSRSEGFKPVPELEAALRPTGTMSVTFASLKCDKRDQPLSELEKTWIREYGIVNAQKIPAARTEKLVGHMIDDLDIYYHIHQNRLDAAEYYFRMEALLQVKSMQFLIRHDALHKKPANPSLFNAMSVNATPTHSTNLTNWNHGEGPYRRSAAFQDYEDQVAILDQQRRGKFMRPEKQEHNLPHRAESQSTEPQPKELVSICTYRDPPRYRPDFDTATQISRPPPAFYNPQPSAILTGDDGVNREYRRATLLAQSTNLPAPTCEYGSHLSGQRTPTFAPARPLWYAPKVLSSREEQRLAAQRDQAEGTNDMVREGTAAHDDCYATGVPSTIPSQGESARSGPAKFIPIRSRPRIVSPNSSTGNTGGVRSDVVSGFERKTSDYQMQLVLLERQNAARLAMARREAAQGTTDTADTGNKVNEARLAFKYTSAGRMMEYCIRTDIQNVGVDPQQSRESIESALAELNPWLRRDGTERKADLLSTAAGHYLDTLKDLQPQTTIPKVSSTTGYPIEKPTGLPPARVQTPFIIQTPDEIMADADSYDTDYDDSCESENDEEFYESRALPFFPVPFVTRKGSRHITFEHSHPAGFACTYYTIRADKSRILYVGVGEEPEREQCLCPKAWRQTKFREPGHNDECNVGQALCFQNPVLAGSENRRLLNSAIGAFFTIRDRNGWWRAKNRAYQGGGPEYEIINSVVPEVDVDEGFVDFPGVEDQEGKTQSQCLHCNMILSEVGWQAKTIHFTACSGYRRVKGLREDVKEAAGVRYYRP